MHARGERGHDTLVKGALLGQLVHEPPFVLDFSGTFDTDFGLEILYVPDSFGTKRHVMLEDKLMYFKQKDSPVSSGLEEDGLLIFTKHIQRTKETRQRRKT